MIDECVRPLLAKIALAVIAALAVAFLFFPVIFYAMLFGIAMTVAVHGFKKL